MPGYVSCNIKGGLGNQLFQIFATIAYGIRTGREVRFCFTEQIGNRSSYWHSFFKGLRQFQINQDDFIYIFYGNGRDGSRIIHQEPSYAYSKIPEYSNVENVLLDGYFQCRDYFKGFENQILEILGEEIRGTFGRRVGEGMVAPKIGMHFRIGDYKHIQHCHPLMPTTYYVDALTTCLKDHDADLKRWKGAVEKMGGVVDDIIEVVYLCEDSDVGDVEKHLVVLRDTFPSLRFRRGLAGEAGVGERECDRDWKEMALLSRCDWFVIPNSSFSWWAATFSSLMEDFNSRRGGVEGSGFIGHIERGGHWVYYPSVWFGPTLAPISDVRDMLNQTGWKRV
jgi:hypothetical protein